MAADQNLVEQLATLEELARRKREDQLNYFVPYPRQREFLEMGAVKRQRLLSGGNQVGKTKIGAYELAVHLTGKYPPGWAGKRFSSPILAWAAGVSSLVTRDTLQLQLLGKPGDWGTGLIPRDAIIGTPRMARGLADTVDTVSIKHANGYASTLTFRSYEMGRAKFQSSSVHAIWLDEMPDDNDIWSECLARISSTKGTLFLTATPLLGTTPLVLKFIDGKDDDCGLVTMGLSDAAHFSAAERDLITRSYPEHERRCRAEGVPFLGSGLVYPVADSAISVEPFPIPSYWKKLAAIDLGVTHPTAVVWTAHNPDTDQVVVYDLHYLKDAGAAVHAGAILQRGREIPCVYPHDALSRDASSGDNVANLYKSFGVNMVGRASFEDGTASVEAGCAVVLDRFLSGRLKIFSHLRPIFDELHLYARTDGKIKPVFDDALAALRYNVISLRYGRTADQSGQRRRASGQAIGMDYDVFNSSDDSAGSSRGSNRNAAGEPTWSGNGRPPSLQRGR